MKEFQTVDQIELENVSGGKTLFGKAIKWLTQTPQGNQSAIATVVVVGSIILAL